MLPQARRQAVSSPLPRPTGLGSGRRATPWLGLEQPHNGRLTRIKPLATGGAVEQFFDSRRLELEGVRRRRLATRVVRTRQ